VTQFVCSRTLLSTLPFFSGLAEAQVDAVLPYVQYRKYPSRFRILRAGETPDGLYVVLSGRVAVMHEDAQGHQFIARVIGSGEFFGELGLLEREPCTASVQSQEPCEILFLARGRVLEFLEQSAGAALAMLRTVVRRLHEAHGKMQGLALATVYERVARVLLETSRVIDGERRVEVGAERIAAMVGASREMVSRVIGDMIRRHVVRRYRRKLIVVDDSALSRPGIRDSQERPAAREFATAKALQAAVSP
jgi:CRP/FNR family cyclic AMP-dependent transcriptional regulator